MSLTEDMITFKLDKMMVQERKPQVPKKMILKRLLPQHFAQPLELIRPLQEFLAVKQELPQEDLLSLDKMMAQVKKPQVPKKMILK